MAKFKLAGEGETLKKLKGKPHSAKYKIVEKMRQKAKGKD